MRGDKVGEGEAEVLRPREPGEDEMLWQLGEDSDEEGENEDAMHAQEEGVPHPRKRDLHQETDDGEGSHRLEDKGERTGLMHGGDEEDDEVVSGSSSSTRIAQEDEFGEWKNDRTR